MRELILSSGAIAEICIKYSVNKFHGKQIQEGSDIFINSEYLGSINGIKPEDITEQDIFYLQYSQR